MLFGTRGNGELDHGPTFYGPFTARVMSALVISGHRKGDSRAPVNRRRNMFGRYRSCIKLVLSVPSLAIAVTLMNAMPAHAAIKPWPSAFHDQQMAVSGGTQYVRVGGHGPAVLLLHGFGDTGDMWVPLAEILVKDHTVIVPDLRGMGLSSHQDGGYEKTAQARDLASILDKLGVQDTALVTHDIGNMVGYALAAQYPARVTRWVVMDAPLPGIGHWDDQLKNPKVWHFNFRGPDVERLVQGANASFLIAFTMNCLQPQPASTTRSATITLRYMPDPVPFTMHSADSLQRLRRMQSTIRSWWRRAS